jgi:hypothetical protein
MRGMHSESAEFLGGVRGRGRPKEGDRKRRYHYTTVDSALAVSQNVFCSVKLFLHRKTHIIQSMTFIFYRRAVMKIYLYVTLFLFNRNYYI